MICLPFEQSTKALSVRGWRWWDSWRSCANHRGHVTQCPCHVTEVCSDQPLAYQPLLWPTAWAQPGPILFIKGEQGGDNWPKSLKGGKGTLTASTWRREGSGANGARASQGIRTRHNCGIWLHTTWFTLTFHSMESHRQLLAVSPKKLQEYRRNVIFSELFW